MNPQQLQELRRIHELQAMLETIETSLTAKGNRDRQGRVCHWNTMLVKVQQQVTSMNLPPLTTVADAQTLPLDDKKSA